MPPKRVKYDDAAIQSQLSSLYLSEFSAASDSLVQLAPVLRNINASKQQDAYLRHLKDFISSKEREIEEVCKANYQVSLDPGLHSRSRSLRWASRISSALPISC